TVPKSGINVSENGKPYEEQKFKTSVPVKVIFEDGSTHFDRVRGLNEGHALARAKANWPGATVEIDKENRTPEGFPQGAAATTSAPENQAALSPEEQSALNDYNKENDFASKVLSDDAKVEDFPYYDGYKKTIDAESKLMSKGKTLFIGGGPVPLSSILFDRAGFPIDTLELDPATAK